MCSSNCPKHVDRKFNKKCLFLIEFFISGIIGWPFSNLKLIGQDNPMRLTFLRDWDWRLKYSYSYFIKFRKKTNKKMLLNFFQVQINFKQYDGVGTYSSFI